MDVLTDAGFYMTLPSNASKDVFKNNTSSSYMVDLAKAIELNGEWVVGLCKVIYPHSWYTLPRDLFYFELNKMMDELQPLVIQKLGRGGKYDPTANTSYNNVTKCIDFKGSGQYKIRVYAPLVHMLGLKDGEWWTLSHRLTPYPCDLKTSIYDLFVYMDIIQYQQVGDSHAPLLGVVTVKGDFGDMLSIEDKVYTEILPLSAITDGVPIEFFIPGDREKYFDLNDILLHLCVKITNADGIDLVDDAPVGLINYPLSTIFSQCNVILGDRLISQFSATHPYRAMIETLLNFSRDTLERQFNAGLFYKDTLGAMDSIVINNGPNRGLSARATFSANSREAHLLGSLQQVYILLC
ncbi:hypothetical protein LDENG_00119470 [Lucifuga dentata]|nr:hypothetical protein LDENG_00119470 [Lucifuga dentata]